MVLSKHLTHFCFPIKQVFHQHVSSRVAYPGILPESLNCKKNIKEKYLYNNMKKPIRSKLNHKYTQIQISYRPQISQLSPSLKNPLVVYLKTLIK